MIPFSDKTAVTAAIPSPACGKMSWCSCSRKRKSNQHITRYRMIKLPLGELLRGELPFEIFMAASPYPNPNVAFKPLGHGAVIARHSLDQKRPSERNRSSWRDGCAGLSQNFL